MGTCTAAGPQQGTGRPPPPPAASPVRTELGWGGQPLAGELGPTFLLTRGGSDQSTEGVAAPRCLQQLGITSMLDLADAFSEEEEVRSAIGAADQTAQQLAAVAWAQSRRRAPAIVRALSTGHYTAHAPNR